MPLFLHMSNGGGVAVRAYDGWTLYGSTDEWGFDHCIVGIAWQIWSCAMLVIVVEAHKSWGSGAIRYVEGTLKGLSVKCRKLTSRASWRVFDHASSMHNISASPCPSHLCQLTSVLPARRKRGDFIQLVCTTFRIELCIMLQKPEKHLKHRAV